MKKLFLSVVVASMILSSCGGDGAKDKSTSTTKAKTEQKEPAKATATHQNEAVNLTLSGDDTMKFNKAEFKVKAGQKVNLTFKNVGKLAKKVMGHNFILLKKGTDIPKFAALAMKAKDNDYIPSEDQIIAHTKVLGPGESTTITFTAPAKGTYDYICSFPGHYGIMNGKFIVE